MISDLFEFKATGENTDGAFSLVEITTPPGNPEPPPHIHHNEDESFYVLEGEMELMVEGRKGVIDAGIFANVLKGTLHAFKNARATPARLLVTITPAGFEGFFEEIGEPVTDLSSLPDVEKTMAAASRYRLLQKRKSFRGAGNPQRENQPVRSGTEGKET